MNDALCLMPTSVSKGLPRLYAQDGLGMDATVHIHLFGAMGDFWITEVDEDGSVAFGYTKLASYPDGELGYISITELQELVDTKFIQEKDLRFLIERDLHFTPKPLKECISK